MDFREKKILFIGPKFHGYEIMIKQELEILGASVDFYPERSYGFEFTLINNFCSSYMSRFQSNHYRRIWKSVKSNKYDFLFVIRGYMIPKFFIDAFKRSNPNSKSIMYQWDSQKTNPFKHIINSFDVVQTFDVMDSKELKIKYLPLFYTKDVEKHRRIPKECDYDFFFMGFFFEERYDAVLKFKEFCKQNGYKLNSFLFMPFSTRVKYFFKGIKIDRTIVSFKHMNRSHYLQTLSRSRIMVDVSNPRQTGIAMRVIESLACNTNVLTNNVYFQNDDVISKSGMVYLFDFNNIFIPKDVFEPKDPQNKEIVFSLSQWLMQIFTLTDES